MEKNRIAVIADIPNWSFDIIAKLMKKELSDIYDIDIFYCITDLDKDLFKIMEKVKEYDVIHFLARKLLIQFEDEKFKNAVECNGYNYENYKNYIIPKITTCVYDHLAINDNGIDYTKIYKFYCEKYIVSSKKLLEIYSNIEGCPKPWGEIIDTIDQKVFFPENLERFNIENIENRELVIGWVGNSKWNRKTENDIDYKGLKTILEVAIEELKNEGYKIKPYYADVNDQYRTDKEMQKYYSQIDIYVCVSLIEGTPRPILEAMGCGVPIVSTDVGVVKEVLGEKQMQFVLQDRTIKALKEKLIEMYNNRNIFKELSEENIKKSVKNFMQNTREQYIELFESIIVRKN